MLETFVLRVWLEVSGVHGTWIKWILI